MHAFGVCISRGHVCPGDMHAWGEGHAWGGMHGIHTATPVDRILAGGNDFDAEKSASYEYS